MTPLVIAVAVWATCETGWAFLPARRQAASVAGLILAVYALQGTVVLNGSTLYRMRLPYVLLQFVFAAFGC